MALESTHVDVSSVGMSKSGCKTRNRRRVLSRKRLSMSVCGMAKMYLYLLAQPRDLYERYE